MIVLWKEHGRKEPWLDDKKEHDDDVTFCDCFAPVPFVLLERVQMSNFYLCVSSEARMYRVESGTLRMGIPKRRAFCPWYKTVCHSQQERNIPFSQIRVRCGLFRFACSSSSHSHSGNFLNARRKRNVEYVEVIRHGTLHICSMREYLEKLSVLKFSSQDLLERFNTWQLTPTCTRKDMFSDPFSGVVLNSLIWNLKLFLLT